jgi:hypothetical protein
MKLRVPWPVEGIKVPVAGSLSMIALLKSQEMKTAALTER